LKSNLVWIITRLSCFEAVTDSDYPFVIFKLLLLYLLTYNGG
jgi:hypothetical protein